MLRWNSLYNLAAPRGRGPVAAGYPIGPPIPVFNHGPGGYPAPAPPQQPYGAPQPAYAPAQPAQPAYVQPAPAPGPAPSAYGR